MTGANEFNNYVGSLFNSGPVAYLGAGRLLSNSGTVSPGGAGVAETTYLTGDFSQFGTGTYYGDLDFADYEPDLLEVSGVSNVGGTAYFNPVNGGWAIPGTHDWTILSSEGGVTNWGLVEDAAPSAVISYELQWPNSTDVDVRTSVDFAPAGLFGNRKAIADAVNKIQSAGGSATFAPYAEELLNMPDVASLGDAYDQLSSESFDASTIGTLEAGQQYTQTLVKRMHSVRTNLEATGTIPGAAQSEEYAAWVEGFGRWGDQDAGDGFTGFEYSIGGVSAGVDWLMDDGFLGGLSFGQAHTDIDLDGDRGNGDIKSTFGSVYTSWFSERQYVDAAFSYGCESFDNKRRVAVGEILETAESDHNGDLYSAYVEAGRNYNVERYILQPFAALQYMYLDEEGYRESGAGGANLIVSERYTNSLISDVGLRFYLPFERTLDTCIPEITVAWRHDFDVDDRQIRAAFDGAPGVSFTTEGDEISEDGLVVGCGLTLLNKKGTSVNIRYNGEIRGDYEAHQLSGGIRIEF
jgi:outer membrane autotransporter protein